MLQERLDLEDMEDLYQLTAKSWLMLDEETYKIKMHPVICDVAKEQLQPDQDKCCQYIMGICYSQMGKYEKAEEYLNRALALNVHFNGEASMVTVRTREHIADNLAKQGRPREAVKEYVALMLEMEKNFGSECPQVKRLKEKEEQLLRL